jgi:PAS domain S-box-containing protein
MGIYEYRKFLHNTKAAMALASLDGRFLECNQAMQAFLGLSQEEICQLTIFALTPQNDFVTMFSKIQQLIKQEQDPIMLETTCKNFQGKDVPVYITVFSVNNDLRKSEVFNLVWLVIEKEMEGLNLKDSA